MNEGERRMEGEGRMENKGRMESEGWIRGEWVGGDITNPIRVISIGYTRRHPRQREGGRTCTITH